ncbi:hypothetical protein [Candidatus Planktophila versatilis]|uniref:DUF4267 domain-containing protein n=1 Tax=Candidatus Planktophila versatilis TaxID=1884905 RepID=A0ABN5BER4_9ACTN|nr:hypothetical protein [Candidatus Planktophila versatilis]ASY16912.1 hypothetical protein A1sIA79_01395 [Candidatus Planktophila versatilis]
MKFDIKKVFPKNPSSYEGFRIIRLIAALFLSVMVARSCIHLFAADGGAQSIAGIDTSVEGGNNIIAIFHQWGAIQLILAILLLVLFFRYPGLTPLVLLTLILDPILRFVAGQQMSLTTTGTPPGEALNGVALYLLLVLILGSLWNKKPN